MNINNFTAIKVGLASPERIREWSYGEVKKPETINYRSQKPERDGLFCERIFGPTKDWECACGKYKKVRYQGVICDRCGVEVTKSSVRRERMGHIELAAPVAHIWYLRGIPSRMSLLLNVPPKQLEEVVYFVSWIVTDPGDTKLSYKQILSEKEFRENTAIYGPGSFSAATGAEAVKTLLEQVDIDKEYKEIQAELEKANGDKRKKLIKRLETVEAFRNSENKPEWMILTVLPVIPPDLRPMLQLDGGRFATSDLNDLYRRVITRNNRLKKLLELGTPAIIVQNEKRMLQEAVDALIDNGRRSKPITGAGGRALKSLSHSLKGKQGRFRQNLLGKRVDFSGRSVIAIGPSLKMWQCGLPKEMAINLYKPFVINELVNEQVASNPKTAEKLIERQDARVWDAVEKVIENHPVFLNRAPTLHRLGIQAFFPRLVDGHAIRVHPLVCPAFNADFDGDQMAVHLPLGELARAETEVLMLGANSILGPKDGKPIVTPGQDLVLGNFYLNMEETAEEFYNKADALERLGQRTEAERWRRYGDNEGHVFKDVDEVLMAEQVGMVHLHSRIAIPADKVNKTCFTDYQNSCYLLTSVGKIIFNSVFPPDFPYMNEFDGDKLKVTPNDDFVELGTDIRKEIQSRPVTKEFKKKDLGNLIAAVFAKYKNGNGDVNSPTVRTSTILDSLKDMGYLYSTIAGMTVALSDISVAPHKQEMVDEGRRKADVLNNLRDRGLLTGPEWEAQFSDLWAKVKDQVGDTLMASLPRMNPINMMAVSGARGNKNHFTQLAGMRGLMARPTQSKSKKEYQPSIIEVPIYSCFREGMSVSEFFISTHGVRKGLTDTALKTAESGYLTRRLVDVAQEVIINEEDCGTERGFLVRQLVDEKDGTIIEKLEERIAGRYTQQAVTDPKTGEVICPEDTYITDEMAKKIVDAGVTEVWIRNVFTCESPKGICRKCYGRNMATGNPVEAGEAIGVMAAQAIGEPGTQLTMRNFHTGGVANKNGDITQGLPRVEELFEARTPKRVAVIAKIDGEVTDIREQDNKQGMIITVTNENDSIDHKCDLTQTVLSNITVGTKVTAGQPMTEGTIAPKELLQVAGVRAAEEYILKEVKKVYSSQSIDISDKHLEVMIKQMLKKVMVTESGDSGLSAGQTLSRAHMTEINDELLDEGKTPAQFSPIMLGISKSAVETDSFLSAASFQETTRVLTDAAVKGKVDHLEGLKENVIIGKLIPAGTGRPEYERETTKRIIEKADKMIEERRAKAAALAEATATKLPDEVLGNEEEDDFTAADQKDAAEEKPESSEPEDKEAE
ncbi:DNA-directed RNA polymerase subunit beta' [Anaerolactibacter massiliensis]|uniref:DNA-directed RNA polymerase subunit beta' n=1 Tax=Anaerolactibacter massiliensis TaxID=2044573 RepID=UPI000CF93E0D|nr:DNA-directed RNA polymerase subunit beta' [Anaerolactibacter massiliensis]MCI6745795.1 DNA-directed RNA polymerase subunit beta' [Anaerolactibacter massiliensis]MDD7681064.1 DNA-directed RNA polymerase subunit beta' [Stecheria intestinalis]MDY4682408.1 DNA-directed RNA polymerase subunit beta' [Lachnospiraceae bacterium]